MDFLAQLNPKQREAVQAPSGAVLVLAGPGSGKTRVLTHRITFLILSSDVAAEQIMAVTFTNKAAREMKERLLPTDPDRRERGLLTAAQVQGLTVGTFHSVCARILRREIGAIEGYDRNFVIYDTDDQLSLVKQALADLKMDPKLLKPSVIHGLISKAKNDLKSPEKMAAASYPEEVAKRVYERYQKLLRENNAFDFDDLLMQAVQIFRRRELLLQAYQGRYQHVLVDEFQDTNVAQYEFIKLLSGGGGNVFVVADEDQSIYGWRGADYRNVLRFRKDFPFNTTILLEENYRSTGNIVEAAMGIIRRNRQRVPKKLFTQRGTGGKVRLVEAYNEAEEAQFVVSEASRLKAEQGIPLSHCAIMYRTNAQSRLLEEEFVRRGLPYQLVRGTRFYERKEIKDAIAYLRLIANPHDGVSMDRVINTPPRSIGGKTMDDLRDWASRLDLSLYGALQQLGREVDGEKLPLPCPLGSRAKRALVGFLDTLDGLVAARDNLPLADLFDVMLERTGYGPYVHDDTQEGEDRWENLMELREVTQEFAGVAPADAMSAFLEQVALVSDVDGLKDGRQGPALLTLHAAKGLEFPVVFIVGLNEKILPLARSVELPNSGRGNGGRPAEDTEALEEECRLLYVGVTRAKDQLYLVHTFRRSIYGLDEPCSRSRFLDEIPHSVLEQWTPTGARTGTSRRSEGLAWKSRSIPGRWTTGPRPSSAGARRDDSIAAQGGPPFAPRFRTGDRVRHATFGEGVVVGSTLTGNDQEVEVNFRGKGLKKLSVNYAPLEKIEK